jgi:4-amino-4-deoxy-L-arabinose transferase-like glycosyltransferase
MDAGQESGARAAWAPPTWLVIAFALSWLSLLGVRPLFNPDEGRYAEIPREMLATGDWLVPHLDGLVYIEKPPLQYWATAASFAVFGTHVWSARLYTGLCGLLCVLVVGGLARRLWGNATGWRAGIMLAGTWGILVMSQQLTLDMSLTFFMTLTLACFCVAQERATADPERARWMWLAWAGAAATFLTKGLIALVLPALTLVLYSLLYRRWKVWSRLSMGTGLGLFALLALPWCVGMQHRVPQFFDFFFVREHFQRFLTRIEDRYEPMWFFIPVLAAGSLPWILPAGRALVSGWRSAPGAQDFETRPFLWLWCVVVFAFFSLSDSKLIPYILPMMPALIIVAASTPAQELRRDLARTALGAIVFGVLVCAGGVFLPHFLHNPARAPYFAQLRIPLLIMGAIALAGGFIARTRREPTLTLALTSYLAVATLFIGARAVAPIYSGASLAEPIRHAIMPGTTLYAVRTYDQSLPFYLAHTMRLVESRGELDFGLTLEPAKAIATLDEFAVRWEHEEDAMALMEPETYALLQQQGLPMIVRSTAPDRLIVSRR